MWPAGSELPSRHISIVMRSGSAKSTAPAKARASPLAKRRFPARARLTARADVTGGTAGAPARGSIAGTRRRRTGGPISRRSGAARGVRLRSGAAGSVAPLAPERPELRVELRPRPGRMRHRAGLPYDDAALVARRARAGVPRPDAGARHLGGPVPRPRLPPRSLRG